jgi:hypothetical protein
MADWLSKCTPSTMLGSRCWPRRSTISALALLSLASSVRRSVAMRPTLVISQRGSPSAPTSSPLHKVYSGDFGHELRNLLAGCPADRHRPDDPRVDLADLDEAAETDPDEEDRLEGAGHTSTRWGLADSATTVTASYKPRYSDELQDRDPRTIPATVAVGVHRHRRCGSPVPQLAESPVHLPA